jgi:non-heme chloroperoxidase
LNSLLFAKRAHREWPVFVLMAVLWSLGHSAMALTPARTMQSRSVSVSDGATLNVEVGGPADAKHTLLFVPGWTMPASLYVHQVLAFAPTHRVVTMDPRGQGNSEITLEGYNVERRARDIYDVITSLQLKNVVIVGWSLGVLETLKMSAQHADAPLAGVVLVDNSVGEATPPPGNPNFFSNLRSKRNETVRGFVRGMFKSSPADSLITQVTQLAQRMPVEASIQLLSYPLPREFWRDSLYALTVPVAYFVTPKFEAQAAAINAKRPDIVTRVFPNAGHALFVDDAVGFNAALREFLSTLK